MLISEAFRSYTADVIAMKNQSRKTEENHYVCMRALIVFFGDVPIESLTFPMIRDWKIALENGRSSETVRNYIIKLRVVLEYCYQFGIPVLNPEKIPVPQRRDKVPEFVTQAEVAQLIQGTDTPRSRVINRLRNKAIISILYASGIRVSELCSLNRGCIIEGSFTVVGKGGKARLCFVDSRTQWYIDEYLRMRTDNEPALFITDNGHQRITPGMVQEIFKNVRKRAGFTKPIHPHTMRHSFATNLMRNGMHIYGVSRLLGHASIQTTSAYLHVTDVNLQNDYQKYHTI